VTSVSALTGEWREDGELGPDGIVWDSWKGPNYSLKKVTMRLAKGSP